MGVGVGFLDTCGSRVLLNSTPSPFPPPLSLSLTVVCPDAHRPPQRLALVDERLKRFPNRFLLRAELGRVVVVDLVKRFAAVGKVAGVDANLFKRVRHHERDLRLEVDVGDEGDVVAVLEQRFANLAARLRLFAPLHRDAHDLGAGVHAALDLFDGGGDVASV